MGGLNLLSRKKNSFQESLKAALDLLIPKYRLSRRIHPEDLK